MADAGVDAAALAVRREEDKKRKQAEKAEKEKQKEANRKAREAAQKAKEAGGKSAAADADADAAVVNAPTVTLRELESHDFGNLFIQSHMPSVRTWAKVGELAANLAGQKVWVRARVATSRKQGKMLCFLQLRESMYTAQAVVFSKESDIVPFAAQLPRETVVDVFGEVTVAPEPIASCSQASVELQVRLRERFACGNAALAPMPRTPSQGRGRSVRQTLRALPERLANRHVLLLPRRS